MEKYLVIESYRGEEGAIYSGTKIECAEYESQRRLELHPEQRIVHNFYTIGEEEYDEILDRSKKLEEYRKTLSEEELAERIVIDGKIYVKWMQDFNKNYKYNK